MLRMERQRKIGKEDDRDRGEERDRGQEEIEEREEERR